MSLVNDFCNGSSTDPALVSVPSPDSLTDSGSLSHAVKTVVGRSAAASNDASDDPSPPRHD
jgi:hypothetical protein